MAAMGGKGAAVMGADAFAVSTLLFAVGLLGILFLSVHGLRGALWTYRFLRTDNRG